MMNICKQEKGKKNLTEIFKIIFFAVQLWPLSYVGLLNKPYENKVILRGQNVPTKGCQPLELLMYIERGIRSFHTGDVGPVGQRTKKLSSVKL